MFRKVQTLRCPQERRGITRIIVWHHCKPPITETQEFKNGNSQIGRVRPQRFELRRCRISSSLDPSSPFATSLMTTSRFFLGGANETKLQGEKLTSNLSRAAKARGNRKEMVRERQRSEKVLTDASHETAMYSPGHHRAQKSPMQERECHWRHFAYLQIADERDRGHVQKKKDRRCSQFLYHSGTLDGLQSRQARRDAGSCWQGFQRIRKKIICVSLQDPFCARWEELRTFTKINCRLEQQLHVITVSNQEADFPVPLVVLHEISKILYNRVARLRAQCPLRFL